MTIYLTTMNKEALLIRVRNIVRNVVAEIRVSASSVQRKEIDKIYTKAAKKLEIPMKGLFHRTLAKDYDVGRMIDDMLNVYFDRAKADRCGGIFQFLAEHVSIAVERGVNDFLKSQTKSNNQVQAKSSQSDTIDSLLDCDIYDVYYVCQEE